MYSLLMGVLMRRVYRDIEVGNLRLVGLLTHKDVVFVCPGTSSLGGTYRGRAELLGWLRRFTALHPTFDVHAVTVSGPPWNTRVAVRFDDAIGDDYRNEVIEYYTLRWGTLRRLEIFLDTERLTAWEQRHPEAFAHP